MKAVFTAVLLASLSGCAHTYVDAEGSRHVVGLVWIKLPVPSGGTAADALRVRAIGLSAAVTPAGTAVVLGYSDSNIVVVRDDRFVDLAPVLAPPK